MNGHETQCWCGVGQKLNWTEADMSDWRLVARKGICQRSYCMLAVTRKPRPVKDVGVHRNVILCPRLRDVARIKFSVAEFETDFVSSGQPIIGYGSARLGRSVRSRFRSSRPSLLYPLLYCALV